jgi:hypothetical protein
MHTRGIIMTVVILAVIAVIITGWWLQTRRSRSQK